MPKIVTTTKMPSALTEESRAGRLCNCLWMPAPGAVSLTQEMSGDMQEMMWPIRPCHRRCPLLPAIPTQEQFPYENLDKLVCISVRPRGMAVYGLLKDYVYQAARGANPISYDIARALDPSEPKSVGIFTGASDPTHYPNGENDGPLGTIVLAEALRKVGHRVSLFIDPQLEPVMGALVDYYGHKYPVTRLDIASPERNTALAEDLQVAIAVEKGGTNPAGKVHSITGYSREGTRAKVDGLFRRVEEQGGVTISAADGINEIGFGNIYDAVAGAVPWATQCKCGCGKGVLCSTPVTHLYPTAISNWGAYALAGALALYTRNRELVHTPETERDIEQIAMDYDVRDGSLGKASLSMDGVPLEATQAMLRIMYTLVDICIQEYTRPF